MVEGDTLHLTIVNPEDDVHSFVLPDLVVPLPGNRTTDTTYVARRAGIYPFLCAVQSHLPMMWGQLVVLSPSAVGSGVPRARPSLGPPPGAGRCPGFVDQRGAIDLVGPRHRQAILEDYEAGVAERRTFGQRESANGVLGEVVLGERHHERDRDLHP